MIQRRLKHCCLTAQYCMLTVFIIQSIVHTCIQRVEQNDAVSKVFCIVFKGQTVHISCRLAAHLSCFLNYYCLGKEVMISALGKFDEFPVEPQVENKDDVFRVFIYKKNCTYDSWTNTERTNVLVFYQYANLNVIEEETDRREGKGCCCCFGDELECRTNHLAARMI